MASGQNVDWAQLAQQWIQMRDGSGQTLSNCASEGEFNTCSNQFEEKGEADMDMDDEEQSAEKAYLPKGSLKTESDALQPYSGTAQTNWHTDNRNMQNLEARRTFSTKRSNHWDQWPNNQVLMLPECQPQIRQANSSAGHIPSLLNINVSNPNDTTYKDNSSNMEVTTQDNVSEVAKKKIIPAWIREGLEKMEKEKQKQSGKDCMYSNISENSDTPKSGTVNKTNTEEVDSNLLFNDRCNSKLEVNQCDKISNLSDNNDNVTQENCCQNYEQKLSALMIVVRQTLTELLLEVTNEEITNVAGEVVQYFKKKASSVQVVHSSALSSLTGKLGLSAYVHSSSDESSDQDENSPTSKSPRSDSDSDSDVDIEDTIRAKKRAFLSIASDIEECVAAAAVREEEYIKKFSAKEDLGPVSNKRRKLSNNMEIAQTDMETSFSSHLSADVGSRKIERDTGKATETNSLALNGKRHKDRATRKERTTRFSDNRDPTFLAGTSTTSFINDMQLKECQTNSSISQSMSKHSQAAYKITGFLTNCAETHCKGALLTGETGTADTNKQLLNPQNIDNTESLKVRSITRHKSRRFSDERSLTKSSTSSSSTSDSETSSSESSDSSRHSRRSFRESSTLSDSSRKRQRRRRSKDREYDSRHYKYRDSYRSRRYHHERTHSRRRSSSIETEHRDSRAVRRSRYSPPSRSRQSRDNSASQSRPSYSHSKQKR